MGTKAQRLIYLPCYGERQEAEAKPHGEKMAEFSEQEATWATGEAGRVQTIPPPPAAMSHTPLPSPQPRTQLKE